MSLGVTQSCVLSESSAEAECKGFGDLIHFIDNPKADIKCVTCDTDGCNGAAQDGPIALLIALPVAITNCFLILNCFSSFDVNQYFLSDTKCSLICNEKTISWRRKNN